MDFLISPASAQAAGGSATGGLSQILILVVFVAIFYFMLIRPQQKRMKDQQAMLAKLAVGDEVVTSGGILGRISEVGDPFVSLEVAEGVRLRVQRSQISQLMPKGTLKGTEEHSMLEFPRWKYVLVALVTSLALIFALPNFFGTDPALQVARKNRAPMDEIARQAVEQTLKGHSAAFSGSYLDDGKLILRFGSVADQLKARDLVNESMAADYISALTTASRAPEALRRFGLRPMPLGLDLRGGLYLLYQVDVNGAVAQLLESYDQGFRRTLASANLPFTDITTYTSSKSSIPNALRISLPPGADVSAVRDALRKSNNDLTFSIGSGDAGPTLLMEMTPTQVKARQDYALREKHHHAAQPRQRARRFGADRRAAGH